MPFDPITALKTLAEVDKRVAAIVWGGLGVFAAAVIVVGWTGGGPETALQTAFYVIGFGALVSILSSLPNLATTFLAWFLTLLFSVWAVLVFAQVVSDDKFTPPLATYGCLIFFLSEGCMETVAAASEPAVEFTRPAAANFTPPLGNKVYIQFSWPNDREDIVALASALVQQGWNVQDAGRGGERLQSALGTFDVRFFHAADSEAARQLSIAVGAALGDGAEPSVKDLSETRFASAATPGQLEVWLGK